MNHENSEVSKSILHPPNRMAHCRYRTVDCTTSATDSTARTNVKGINKARGVTCHFLPHPFKFISPQFSSRAIFVSTKKCTSPLPRGTFIKFPLNSVNSEWRGSNYATNREILRKPHRHWTKQCSLQIPRRENLPQQWKSTSRSKMRTSQLFPLFTRVCTKSILHAPVPLILPCVLGRLSRRSFPSSRIMTRSCHSLPLFHGLLLHFYIPRETKSAQVRETEDRECRMEESDVELFLRRNRLFLPRKWDIVLSKKLRGTFSEGIPCLAICNVVSVLHFHPPSAVLLQKKFSALFSFFRFIRETCFKNSYKEF